MSRTGGPGAVALLTHYGLTGSLAATFMPKTSSSIDKIRAELAWVTETPDPNWCGCRNLQCCEETGRKPGACMGVVATKFWTFRWEYYCAPCREYGWCGTKTRG
jgi:hypothetical protein